MFVLVLAFLLLHADLTFQPGGKQNTIEVVTYLRTQLPPREGAPVCLTGGVETIGRIKRVHLLPGHADTHDAWELIMEISGRDAAGITTDSIVYARSPEYHEANRNCGSSSHDLFLDINAIGAGPAIANHAVLKGEVTYSAEIGYVASPPWWRRVSYVAAIGGVVLLLILSLVRRHQRRIGI